MSLCSLVAAWLPTTMICAEDPTPKASDFETTPVQWDVQKTSERNVRLNFISTSWDKVLKEVAEDSGSTLVMHDVPQGRFSRHDWRRYNRDDAVQILNRELEQIGFRILIKEQFLTVIETRRDRVEYQRPIAPAAPTEAVQTTAQQVPQPVAQKPSLTPVPSQASPEPRVALVEHAEPTQSSPSPALAISTQNRPALDIARQIHNAFQTRSRLENKGPNGLPAFVVTHFEEDKTGEAQFTVEIDTENDQLLITADKSIQSGLKSLISRIDVNPLGKSAIPTLVSGNGSTADIGEKLKQPLAVMRQATQKRQTPPLPPQTRNPQWAANDALAQVDGGTPPQMEPTPETLDSQIAPQAGQMGEEESAVGVSSGLIGNLKGDVTIEALDDLDLLILRGNEADVTSVMRVIQAVEQMAVGSLPEIHLLKLQHVNSESLASLLGEVYEQLAELRNDNAQQSAVAVNIVPVVSPNAILILAPANSMDAILQLADELDQPIDPTHEVDVIRLQHAVAATVVETLQEFYEERPGLGTRLHITSDFRTNSIIVQARPRDLSEIKAVIKKIDADKAESVSQLKIFPLKSALADELAEFLNAAIQSVTNPQASTVGQATNLQGANQNDAKSVVLEFLNEDGKQLARSGILHDIRFNADTRTNSLAVTAGAQSMPLIEELIRILDRPSETVAEIKVFELKNADAIDAVELLTELFTDEETNNDDGALGIELVGATDSSSSLIPLRFSTDARTNSVIAVGGAEALRIVEAILYRLDAADSRQRTTTVIKLRNAPASDVATAINTFLQSQRELATLDPDRVSTSQLLQQEVIVTPEPISNNLLISATPAYFSEIEKLARELDAEPAQVVIQALLVEVELDNTDEFGIELGLQDPVLFDRSVVNNILTVTETIFDGMGNPTATNTRIVSQEAAPGFNFNNEPLGNNNGPMARSSVVGSQGLSNFGVNRVNNDLGYGGLVLSASSESVNLLIRALAARRTVRVLSRPQIRALDNQLAQVQVGQVVPVSDGVSQTNNSVVPLITRDPAGIILTVTPRISPEGEIVMEVVAEKSVYTDEGVTIFTDITTGLQVTSPIKNISTAQTTVKVPDGQTIVLAGMITDTEDILERKVPFLGDLPILGKAFRFDSQTTERTELLIFLTPRIVHNAAVNEHIKQVEAQRIHYFQEDAEEVHGPIFGVPQEEFCPIPGQIIEDGHYHGLPGSVSPLESDIPSVPPAVAPPLPSLHESPSSGVMQLDDPAIQQVPN